MPPAPSKPDGYLRGVVGSYRIATAPEALPAAHGICPYSKAVHGNSEVETTVI